ncbi:MAG: LysM peptidoglycan-binding domain-containing protein [Anaerolineaceae bacterium]|nr:LysM peptidoglycan-binding domain-containing protein [Anaerolineaceae bacterium]
MKMKLDFKPRRWTLLLVIGSVLLTTMGFTAAPAAAVLQATCGSTYIVQSGDTLSSIAVLCGTSLSALESANTQITDVSLIFAGEQINIPSGAVIPVTGGSGTYTVIAGDTLSSIAVNAGVTLAALEAVNPQITNPSLIFIGEVINLPSGAVIPVTGGTAVPTPVPGGSTYIVVSGDTMSNIAVNAGVTLAALEAVNPQITDPSQIFVGEVINLPSGAVIPVTGGTAVPTAVPGGSTYTVVSGDTLSSIAARFGVTLSALEASNPQITNPSLIFPGNVINIP